MNNDRDESLRPIPEPEDTGQKEVYAFFGLCSYYAQVLEQGVVNLAVGLHARGLTQVVAADVSSAFDRSDRKTLGQLLHDVRRKVEMSAETESALQEALDDRNHLCHGFFVKHDVDFGSNPGRHEMIAELRAMTERFQVADRLVDAVWIPLWENLGLTDGIMQAELERMRAEADRREVSG